MHDIVSRPRMLIKKARIQAGGDVHSTDDHNLLLLLLLLLRPEPVEPAAQPEGPLSCGRYTVHLCVSACTSQRRAVRASFASCLTTSCPWCCECCRINPVAAAARAHPQLLQTARCTESNHDPRKRRMAESNESMDYVVKR